jgi:hypothetical protein
MKMQAELHKRMSEIPKDEINMMHLESAINQSHYSKSSKAKDPTIFSSDQENS